MKKHLAFFLMCCMLFTLCGCGPASQTEPAAELQELTVLLDWFPNTNHTGLYVAQDQGYYQQAGLEVKIVQPAEGGTAQLVAAGKGDFGISYQEEVTAARSQDVPVLAIAAIIQHNTSGYASPADKNIKTPRDFAGKTYGGWGSPTEEALLKSLMDKYDADFSKVKIVNIGAADFFASMEKNADFSLIFEGWTGIEAQQKNIDLNFIPLRDEGDTFDFYTPLIITNEETAQKNPALVRKFMQATSRGYQYAMAHPEEAAEILLAKVPELDRELVLKSQQYLKDQYQSDAPRWGEMKKEVWQAYADFMFKNGLIEKKIDPEKAFSNQFLPE
ncbi:MAG TPA: ABC transporter substrate-binding protein [Syntrophomonadaceae bacterium]|nr:ABC transporter substrate-binding protein [Syntrophomonadaceae bacterium]